MLAIKLRRIGKKHQPSYRLVVAEKRSKLLGKYLEDLGWFNPITKKSEFNKDRISYWMGSGAKPTDTVHNLLISLEIIKGKKRKAHKESKKESAAVEEAPQAATESKKEPESPKA